MQDQSSDGGSCDSDIAQDFIHHLSKHVTDFGDGSLNNSNIKHFKQDIEIVVCSYLVFII